MARKTSGGVTRVLGVDPGTNGALAIVEGKRVIDILDMPVKSYAGANGKSRHARGRKTNKRRRFVDGEVIADWIEKHSPDAAVIESVHSFGNEGRASLAKFMTAFGVVLGAVQTMRVPITLVSPPVWKRRLGLIGKSKEASHRLACRMYPAYKKAFAGPKGGARIDRAEAALLAHYRSLILV